MIEILSLIKVIQKKLKKEKNRKKEEKHYSWLGRKNKKSIKNGLILSKEKNKKNKRKYPDQVDNPEKKVKKDKKEPKLSSQIIKLTMNLKNHLWINLNDLVHPKHHYKMLMIK